MIKIISTKKNSITSEEMTALLKKAFAINNIITVEVFNGELIVIKNFNNEWYFIENTLFPYASDDNLESIADFLVNYSKKLAIREHNIEILNKKKEKLETLDHNSDEWHVLRDSYSDSYKSLFGHRPK